MQRRNDTLPTQQDPRGEHAYPYHLVDPSHPPSYPPSHPPPHHQRHPRHPPYHRSQTVHPNNSFYPPADTYPHQFPPRTSFLPPQFSLPLHSIPHHPSHPPPQNHLPHYPQPAYVNNKHSSTASQEATYDRENNTNFRHSNKSYARENKYYTNNSKNENNNNNENTIRPHTLPNNNNLAVDKPKPTTNFNNKSGHSKHFLAINEPIIKDKVTNSSSSEMFSDMVWAPAAKLTSNQEVNSNNIRVGTYNVLAPSATFPHFFPLTNLSFLRWEHRKYRLISEIEHANLDVICLQECEYFYEFLEEALLMKGYKGAYMQRPNRTDGCAIVWKDDKFTLVETKLVDYNALASQNIKFRCDCIGMIAILENRVSGESICVATTHIYWKPTFSLCKLKQVHMLLNEIDTFLKTRKDNNLPDEISTNTKKHKSNNLNNFSTSTTQTSFYSSKDDDISIFSTSKTKHSYRKTTSNNNTLLATSNIAKYITVIDVEEGTESLQPAPPSSTSPSKHTLSSSRTNSSSSSPAHSIPIIICGDFNISPSSGIYQFITNPEGSIDLSNTNGNLGSRCEGDKYEKIGAEGILMHPLSGLKSAYATCSNDNTEPQYTTYAPRHKGTLDYIFYHPGNLQPVACLSLPDAAKLQNVRGLPNEKWGSDHLLLGCEFAITGSNM